jgi:hypothetical protein
MGDDAHETAQHELRDAVGGVGRDHGFQPFAVAWVIDGILAVGVDGTLTSTSSIVAVDQVLQSGAVIDVHARLQARSTVGVRRTVGRSLLARRRASAP